MKGMVKTGRQQIWFTSCRCFQAFPPTCFAGKIKACAPRSSSTYFAAVPIHLFHALSS